MQEFILKNLISILFIVLIAFNFINGFSKGFIKMVISLGSFILSIILTRIFTPVVAEAVKNVTNIESPLTSSIYDALIKSNIYDQINIPWINSAVDTGNIQESLKNGLCNGLANGIINLLCGIGVFIATLIILKLLMNFLDVVNYIPLVGQFNKILGGVLGVAETILLFCVIFAVLKAFNGVPQIKTLTDNIQSSFLVGSLYDNNIVYNFFTNLFSNGSKTA